jgi:pimeloyl-ACP methyl ester carboxylesterase
MKYLPYILGVLVLLAAAPLLLVALGSRSIIFHPTTTRRSTLERLAAAPGWSSATVPLQGGGALVGLVRPATVADARWVVFFGGNAFDLPANVAVAQAIAADQPVGIATFAYRGYDGSSGSPSEAALVADASAIVSWLWTTRWVLPSRTILVGHSIGTGVAAQAAAALSRAGTPPAGLLLAAPYRSIARLFDEAVPLVPVSWALRDRFDTEAVIDAVACPVLIVHGAEDRLIPAAHGRALAERLGARATWVELPRTGHEDIWEQHAARVAARDFVAKVVATPLPNLPDPPAPHR